MRSKVVRWGNSLGLRIPAATAREMLLVAGSIVDLQLTSGSLVVRPVPGPATLQALLGREVRESLPDRETREAGQAEARRFAAWRPGRGDLVLVTAEIPHGEDAPSDPPRRVVLVVSPAAYSAAVGLALVCPVINGAKGYPFEVGLPGELVPNGVVLADQVGVLDLRARGFRRVCRVPDEVVRKVQERILALLG